MCSGKATRSSTRSSIRAGFASSSSDSTHDRASTMQTKVRGEVRNTFLHFWEEVPQDESARMRPRAASLPNLADLRASAKNAPAEEAEKARLMIKNIPCRMSKQKIVQVLEEIVPSHMYESIHVPQRQGRSRHQDVNLGYFFLMAQQKDVQFLTSALEGKPFGKAVKSQKKVVVTAGCYKTEQDKAAEYGGVLPNGLSVV